MVKLLISTLLIIYSFPLMSQNFVTGFPSDYAFGYNCSQASGLTIGPVKFQMNNPSVVTLLSAQPNSSKILSASWANEKWYGTDDSYPYSKLYFINTANGVRTLVGTCYTAVQAMAYDWTTNSMYCIGFSSTSYHYELYRLGLTTAYVQFIAELPISCKGLACDDLGRLFTINIDNAYLYEVNKINGSLRVVGPLGVSIYSSCNLEYDNSDSSLYLVYYNYPQGYLQKVDILTGAALPVGNFPQQANISGLAIQNQPLTTYPDDIGVVNINHPVPSTLLTNDEQVSITLVNYGNTILSDIPVYYSMGEGALHSAVFTGPIYPNTMAIFTFTETEDLSQPLTYSIKAWTALSADNHPENDTAQITFSSYCNGLTKASDAYISQVVIGSINNPSGPGVNGYQDFTSLSTSILVGESETLTVTNAPGFTENDALGVWIDWNRNGIFGDDASVEVLGGPEVFQSMISIPLQVAPGLVRMRISLVRGYYPSPCYVQNNGEYEDYLLNVTLPECDLKLVNIINPLSSHYLGNNESVQIQILNNGLSPQGPFDVHYQIDTLDVVTQSFTGTLLSLEDTVFTFLTTIDLSTHGETYFIKIWTSLGCDTIHSNDTLSDTLQNLYGIYCQASSEICDSWIAHVIFKTIDNVSECGENGYSDYTNLSTTLARGESALLTHIPPAVPSIYDGCRVYVDWNQNGDFEEWEFYSPIWNYDGNWEVGIMPPINALTGNTRLRIRYTGDMIPPPCGNILMGEAEDYTIDVTESENDIGIQEILGPQPGPNLGASEHVSVRLVNYGSEPQNDFQVNYRLNNDTVITEIYNQVLEPLSTIEFTFNASADFSQENNTWIIKAWTNLSNDEHHSNDTAEVYIEHSLLTYCEAGAEVCDEYIKRVVVKDIDTTTQCTPGGYHNYSSLSANVSIGETFTIDVYNDEEFSYDEDSCGIWIDWNQDGDFYDEQIFVNGGPTHFYASVNVPSYALTGPTRLRIRINYFETLIPCDISSYGEVEDYTLNVLPGGNIGIVVGNINYNNNAKNALDSVRVYLIHAGDTLAEAMTGTDGSYSFTDVPYGSYSVYCDCSKPWGGVNAIDGLTMLRHFVQLITLTPLRSLAGDVDGNGTVNANDGLQSIRRFVGAIEHFSIDDWIFEETMVEINSPHTTIPTIQGLCAGDVDGSYVP